MEVEYNNPVVSMDEFSGMGPSEKELAEQLNAGQNTNVIAEAMKILQNPEQAHAKQKPIMTPKAVRAKTYDLSDDKDRRAYQSDLLKISRNGGTFLLLDRPPKQFVQTPIGFKYIAYLEWIEYGKPSKKRKDAE